MRLLAVAALTALTFGLFDARPASAAAPAWECMGPPASCEKGSSATSVRKSRVSNVSTKKHYSQHSSGAVSYSSGGGMASYYSEPQRTASGGWFNPNAMTAAHKTLPFGTKVRVTNRHNGRSVIVTINDRGPYVRGRVIDLSSAAAGAIGMKGAGVAPVSVEVLGRS